MPAFRITLVLFVLAFAFWLPLVQGNQPGESSGTEIAFQKSVQEEVTTWRTYHLSTRWRIGPEHLTSVQVRFNGGEESPEVLVELTREGATLLEQLTSAHVNRRVATVIGSEVYSVHKIREPISGGQLRITVCADANRLARCLEAGFGLQLVDDFNDAILALTDALPTGIRLKERTFLDPSGKPVTEAYLEAEGKGEEGKQRILEFLASRAE
jgi:hypothetical protein